ncbi:hypothetical protein Pint_23693 [Pistacia integerrima]|uniref:Uncharacterized protein n=1 Tax=Pistacia integerrima TaxID=434235 RepID=A0ACC0YNR2_9ROSI|nr:hypothetical protein Pint_23693 [Pistacia integerrima]
MNSRSRPLHTCGVVISSIVQRVYARSQGLNGPLGSIIRTLLRLAQMANPFMHALEYKWLAILYFSDYLILAFESIFETLFPPSKHVFNKIDELVQTAETLPGKFDEAINKFPGHVPVLDWVLIQIISWLNFGISTLKHWGFENAKEKEIVMDVSNSNELSSAQKNQSQDAENDTVFMTNIKKHDMKGTYKEALEKGRKENGIEKNKKEKENKDGGTMKETDQKHAIGDKEIGYAKVSRSEENITANDPILELFESGWLTNAARDDKGNWLSRSVSYTG